MRTGRVNSSSDKKFLNFICIVVIIISLISASVLFFNNRMKDSLNTICIHRGKQEAVNVISRSIADLIADEDLTYSDFVSIVYNANGNISSIETLTQNVNIFQSELSESINESLETELNKTVKIPLGTISGVSFFSGRGPDIKLKVIPIGNVETKVNSEFISSGINQTKHRITVTVTAEISTVLPMYSADSDVVCEYVLAETVIVGDIPQTYFDVNS